MIRSDLERQVEALADDDPLKEDFLELLEDGFELPEFAVAVTGTQALPVSTGTRHFGGSVGVLNENDLIAWIPDPTWDESSHRAFVLELARRERAGRFDARNAGVIRAVLTREGR
ncbi:MAG: hypothetical protein L3K14_08160 [Thermoplasmata archaeon]|nr:hypothetical protein [Thermoplasmata archaeon]